MAKIYITEFAECAVDARGIPVAAPKYPPSASQPAMSITGSSTQSAAFNGRTNFIEFHVDAICSVAIDANPIAHADYGRVGSGERVFVGVVKGHKLAVISNT